MTSSARLIRHRDGIPVYEYPPFTAPVTVIHLPENGPPEKRRHIHNFPVLAYVPSNGAVFVAAPGETIDPTWLHGQPTGIGLLFDPAALGDGHRSPWPAWRNHPLLFPFLHDGAGGILRLTAPQDRRALWDRSIASIEDELRARREGYRQAAVAHLTLLLIELARLTDDMIADLRRSGEPLIADVFAVIEGHIGEPLSLRDVAAELGLTPGHLTTVVRRRTGRTVQQWIAERRMTEARSLLAETDLTIAEIARHVGIADPAYFARLFQRRHGVPPRRWREQ